MDMKSRKDAIPAFPNTLLEPRYMNLRFDRKAREDAFRAYCESARLKMTAVFNAVMNIFLDIDTSASVTGDRVKALEKAASLSNQINWSRVRTVLDGVRERDPIASRATEEDILISIIGKGLSDYEQSLSSGR